MLAGGYPGPSSLALVAADVDHIVVTGDVTHRGRNSELEQFYTTFEPILDRLTVVPGNHDCLGDNVTQRIMPGARVTAYHSSGSNR